MDECETAPLLKLVYMTKKPVPSSLLELTMCTCKGRCQSNCCCNNTGLCLKACYWSLLPDYEMPWEEMESTYKTNGANNDKQKCKHISLSVSEQVEALWTEKDLSGTSWVSW